jgi:hypothetical protein
MKLTRVIAFMAVMAAGAFPRDYVHVSTRKHSPKVQVCFAGTGDSPGHNPARIIFQAGWRA